MVIIYHCTCHTGCMKIMRTCSRGYILNMPFGFGKVIGHMASATSRISSFGDTIQYKFFCRHSGGKGSQHITVVREKEVFSFGKYLSDGQLYPVMSGIRSVKGPAKGLQQISGRLFIERTPQRHQVIPFLQQFHICGFYIVLFHTYQGIKLFFPVFQIIFNKIEEVAT